jgi:uncharacterized membrane protein YkoI
MGEMRTSVSTVITALLFAATPPRAQDSMPVTVEPAAAPAPIETGAADVPDEAKEREAPARSCLTAAEIRDAVQDKHVVSQVTALRAARGAVAGDAVRAHLCRKDGGLVYAITVLKKDGKVSRVFVDGPTGKVIGSR